jgi:protocatechuate 3,4-dioxygenase beta subunit
MVQEAAMYRRLFAALLTFASAALPLLAAGIAQDAEFMRAWERTQSSRPGQLGWQGRIAPQGEPGDPLVIHGRVVDPRGAAVANAVVFAYHTDRAGLYDRPGTPPHSWRLRGWVKTDARGRFEFQTIRPGSYPQGNNPAHVHFTIVTEAGARYWGSELQFEDDPLITAERRRASAGQGESGPVRPIRRVDDVQHVDVVMHLREDRRF